jgi:hypothetical protein
MGKDRSFGAKVAKGQVAAGKVCPVCKEVYTTLKYVTGVKKEAVGSWRYNEKLVGVCKCNTAEIYG